MITIRDLKFRYPQSDFVLDIPQLEIADQEKVAFVGPSGCGKTTLLNLIAGIALPDSGTVTTANQGVSSMADSQRRNFRIAEIGFVFQQFELVDYLDLKSNIILPYLINPALTVTADVHRRSEALADGMGLAGKLNRLPSQLSQGEKQRCAICRSLITQPKIILADEPTGNLDPKNKTAIIDLMTEQADKFTQTLVMVTHDMSILSAMDRTIDFQQFQQPSPISEGTKT